MNIEDNLEGDRSQKSGIMFFHGSEELTVKIDILWIKNLK